MTKSMTIKEYEEHIPAIYRGNYRKAISGKSKAAALKAMCLDCVNWQRLEISQCTVETCPLHPYRPFQKDKGGKKSSMAGDFTDEQEKSDPLPETGDGQAEKP